MEEQIKTGLPETPEEKLTLTMDVTNRTVKRVNNLETEVNYLKNDQPLAPGEYNLHWSSSQQGSSQVYGCTSLEFKQSTTFKAI